MADAPLVYDDAYIRRILLDVKTIAMVGASTNEMRPSYFAMLYLQGKGYRVIPVNPRYAGQKLLGETVYPDLASIPLVPDMVQIFRRSEEAPAIVEAAIEKGIRVIWMQLGVRHDEAARRAEAAGCRVVMDRCPKIEYGRLFGEIGWLGVNRGTLSAGKGQALRIRRGGVGRWGRRRGLAEPCLEPGEPCLDRLGPARGRRRTVRRVARGALLEQAREPLAEGEALGAGRLAGCLLQPGRHTPHRPARRPRRLLAPLRLLLRHDPPEAATEAAEPRSSGAAAGPVKRGRKGGAPSC